MDTTAVIIGAGMAGPAAAQVLSRRYGSVVEDELVADGGIRFDQLSGVSLSR